MDQQTVSRSSEMVMGRHCTVVGRNFEECRGPIPHHGEGGLCFFELLRLLYIHEKRH